MEEGYLKIGEIAAFYNVSVKAIRIYEKKGILLPAKVDPETGYRYYTADQVERLSALLELKALGFSLNEVKNILEGDITSAQLHALLARKQRHWLDAMVIAQEKSNTVQRMMGRLAGAESNVSGMSEEQRARWLARLVCTEGTHTPIELGDALWL